MTTWEDRGSVWMSDHMEGRRDMCGCVTHGRVGCMHV